jgi:cytochrome P450
MDPGNEILRSYFHTFGRGARVCLGQNLAQNELKTTLLMTIRDYDFECATKPNLKPKTAFTDMDAIYGDIVFQELGLEAKPLGL